MITSTSIRQFHRWMSAAFTATFLVVTAVLAAGGAESAAWVYYLPLLPLAALFLTGLYLFVLPYVTRRRRARAADEPRREAAST